MSESDEVLAKLQKDHGLLIGSKGVTKLQVPRIPTGIFAFDLATGGGFPQGRVSIVYGPESSIKTTLTLKTIATVQNRLKKKAVLVDIENTHDNEWAAKCGVNNSELLYFQPDTAEQAVDVVEGMLCAEDVGVVVIDSIPALVTESEIEKDGAAIQVGGNSIIVSKLIKKAVVALTRESKREHIPALVCINQTRFKIGQMFGNPEYFPGGNQLKFASSFTVRLFGKDKIEKGIHPHLPAFKEIQGVIMKNKMAIVSKGFDFNLCLIPNNGMQITEVPSWNIVTSYLKKHGLLVKNGTKWSCMNVEFDALYHIQERYDSDPDLRVSLQQEIVSREILTPFSVDSDADGTGE